MQNHYLLISKQSYFLFTSSNKSPIPQLGQISGFIPSLKKEKRLHYDVYRMWKIHNSLDFLI